MAGITSWTPRGQSSLEIAGLQRAAIYRERAAHLSVMAEVEPVGSLRTRLLELAADYEELAENLEISSPV
jgi:hypothetical protein